MALSRREFQQLMERVGKCEARLRQIDDALKIIDNKLRPDNLARSLKNWEDAEKKKAESPQITGI